MVDINGRLPLRSHGLVRYPLLDILPMRKHAKPVSFCRRVVCEVLLACLLVGCGSESDDGSTAQLPKFAVGRLGGDEFLLIPSRISLIDYSPDGRLIASVGSEIYGAVPEGVQVWEIATGKEVGPEELRSSVPAGMRWSPDGTQFVISHRVDNKDWVVEIWSVKERRRVRRLGTTTEACMSVDWSSNGNRIAAADPGRAAYVWNAETGEEVARIEEPAHRIAFTPDGSSLVIGNMSGVYLHSENATTKILDLPVHKLGDVEVSPRGDLIAIGFEDGIALWSLKSEQLTIILDKTGSRLHQLSFDKSGRYLACLEPFKSIHVWDVDEAHFLKLDDSLLYPTPQASLDISPDGETIAMAFSRIMFRRLSDGRRVHDFNAHAVSVSVQVSGDGRYAISVGSEEDVRLWDLKTLQFVRTLSDPGGICDAYLFPETDTIGIRTVNRPGMRMYEFPSFQEKTKAPPGTDVLLPDDYRRADWPIALTKDGTSLLYPDDDGNIHIWSTDGTEERGTIRAGLENVRTERGTAIPPAIEVSPDGKLLARGYWVAEKIEIVDLASKSVIAVLDEGIHRELAFPMAFSHDNSLIYTVGEDCVSVIDIESQERVKQIETQPSVYAIEVSPDGRWLAISERGHWNFEEGRYDVRQVRLVSTETGENLPAFETGDQIITRMRFTPDSSKLLTAAPNSTITVWDVSAAIRDK